MAQYATLKAAINAVIKANGQKEITGTVLNEVLTSMVNSLGANYQFAGVATPSTNPGTPDQNVFYLAFEAGTYTNFNATVLPAGISILMWNGSWSSQTFYTIDATPTASSNNLVSSGAVFDAIKTDGSAYDVSAHFPTGGPNSDGKFTLDYILANANTLIPAAWRKGGMSIRFVQSSDNNYAQFRCMPDEFTTDVTKWQGEDAAPVVGSKNLINSNGVALYADAINGGSLELFDGNIFPHLIFSQSGFGISITTSDYRVPGSKRISAVLKGLNAKSFSIKSESAEYPFVCAVLNSSGTIILSGGTWGTEERTVSGDIREVRISVKHVVDGSDVDITPSDTANIPITIALKSTIDKTVEDNNIVLSKVLNNNSVCFDAQLNNSNIANRLQYIQGGYSSITNFLSPVPNDNNKRIRVDTGSIPKMKFVLTPTASYPIVYAAFDENNNLISGSTSWTTDAITITGVCFLRISVKHVVDGSDVNITPSEVLPILIQSMNSVDYLIDNIFNVGYYIKSDTAVLEDGYVDYGNGLVNSSSSNYKHTGYIEIAPNTNISTPVLKVTSTGKAGLAFYDEDKAYISGYNDPTATGETMEMNQGILLVPANAKYIRVSVFNQDGSLGAKWKPWYIRSEYATNSELFKAIDGNKKDFDRISVVAYNIGRFSWGVSPYGLTEEQYQEYLPKYKEFLGKEKADVVCVTEYGDYIDANNTHNTDNVLFKPLYASSKIKTSGIKPAMFSKYYLTDTSQGEDLGGITDNRGYVKGYITVHGKKICVICLHLWYPNTAEAAAIRQDQMQDIIDMVADEKYCIICGDFNAQSGIGELDIFTDAGFVLANGGYFGTKNTFSYTNPTQPLDNIVVTPNIIVEDFKVLTEYAEVLSSDHLPIKANVLIY